MELASATDEKVKKILQYVLSYYGPLPLENHECAGVRISRCTLLSMKIR